MCELCSLSFSPLFLVIHIAYFWWFNGEQNIHYVTALRAKEFIMCGDTILVFLFCIKSAQMEKHFRSCLGWILALAIIIGIAFFSRWLFDWLLLPWAFERAAGSAVTGNWVGSLTTATGRPLGVVLELSLPEPKGGGGFVRDWENAPYGELEGTARVCEPSGEVHSYTVEGEPENRQATRLSLYATPSESPAPEGLTFSWMNGNWDRVDRLTLTVQFYWKKDGASISGPEYPDTQSDAVLELTRGGEVDFQTICASLPDA
jgi:hypothetical protein